MRCISQLPRLSPFRYFPVSLPPVSGCRIAGSTPSLARSRIPHTNPRSNASRRAHSTARGRTEAEQPRAHPSLHISLPTTACQSPLPATSHTSHSCITHARTCATTPPPAQIELRKNERASSVGFESIRLCSVRLRLAASKMRGKRAHVPENEHAESGNKRQAPATAQRNNCSEGLAAACRADLPSVLTLLLERL